MKEILIDAFEIAKKTTSKEQYQESLIEIVRPLVNFVTINSSDIVTRILIHDKEIIESTLHGKFMRGVIEESSLRRALDTDLSLEPLLVQTGSLSFYILACMDHNEFLVEWFDNESPITFERFRTSLVSIHEILKLSIKLNLIKLHN